MELRGARADRARTIAAFTRDGSTLAVGASLDSSDDSDTVGDPANQSAPNSGAIYLFQRRPDNTYLKQAFIKPRRAAPLDASRAEAADITLSAVHRNDRGCPEWGGGCLLRRGLSI